MMLNSYRSWSLLLTRIALGGTFLAHGYMKWAMFSDPGQQMLMKVLAIVEPLCGLAVLLGLLTRYAAGVLGIVMIGAIYMKVAVWGVPYAAGNMLGWEVDFLLLAASVAVMTHGAGKYALEKMMGWEAD